MRARPFALGLAVAFATASVLSCTDPPAQFDVRCGSDFAPRGHVAAVFGVFKEGRMSPDAWPDLARLLAPAFGGKTCAPEYDDAFVKGHLGVAAAVDDKVRENGITDSLLDAFGVAAHADTIVVFTVAGHPPQTLDAGPTPPPVAGSASMRGNRRMPGMHEGADRFARTDGNAFEVSATVFSIPLHKSVAVVSMRYTGATTDDGLRSFAGELQKELPGLACGAWADDAHLDEEAIHAVPSE